jgi:hypothetical protein
MAAKMEKTRTPGSTSVGVGMCSPTAWTASSAGVMSHPRRGTPSKGSANDRYRAGRVRGALPDRAARLRPRVDRALPGHRSQGLPRGDALGVPGAARQVRAEPLLVANQADRDHAQAYRILRGLVVRSDQVGTDDGGARQASAVVGQDGAQRARASRGVPGDRSS